MPTLNRFYARCGIERYTGEQDELKKFAVLLEILAFAGSFFKTAQKTDSITPNTIVGRALLLIEEDFKNIKIAEIAERLYINSAYLSKIFKDECGITLSKYLILRKLAEAKKYLYMGISVKEACSLSGFNIYSNFIRTFKKIEGTSPGNSSGLFAPF